jgi:aryl-alcohol dehydrogenase-like predicted oxidoreductase
MQQRRLGNSGLMVSAIGLGCMSMSGTYGKADDAASTTLLHQAIDLGINFLDSSDMYGWGHNELLIGKAIAGRRESLVLATKCGYVRQDDGGMGIDGRPAHIMKACDASLKRLGTDVIDLYYLHRVDTKLPIEETVGAMSRLVEQGKVRYLGLSEAAPATLRRAHAVHPIAALQTEYSLLYREAADAALPTCRELDTAFVAYSPLARGLLSGVIHSAADVPEGDRRLQHPRFQGDNLERNVELVRRIEAIAEEKQCKPSQLVLAWLLAQGEDIIPIPGTKRKTYLEDNVGAASVTLSPEELAHVNAAVPAGAMAGERYPAGAMGALQR